jgi:hypothetical protein
LAVEPRGLVFAFTRAAGIAGAAGDTEAGHRLAGWV